jgi:hypothetical protein
MEGRAGPLEELGLRTLLHLTAIFAGIAVLM